MESLDWACDDNFVKNNDVNLSMTAVRLCCVFRVPFHPVLIKKTPKKRIFHHGPKTGRFLAFHLFLKLLALIDKNTKLYFF